MTHYTGTAVWDAVGSIGIGLLLGAIATFLVQKNRQLLLGRSMNPKEVQVSRNGGWAKERGMRGLMFVLA
jgi:divalent metal cation (Fe/Co/Zn/Cd) transporter